MSASQGIPLPRPTVLSQPHWDGCRDGALRFQRCRDCGAAVFIPQPVCTGCFGSALEWVTSSALQLRGAYPKELTVPGATVAMTSNGGAGALFCDVMLLGKEPA